MDAAALQCDAALTSVRHREKADRADRLTKGIGWSKANPKGLTMDENVNLRSTSTGSVPLRDATSGRTVIADPAVARVAAMAARGVPGVFALGAGGGRALGALRDAVAGGDLTQGVHVEVGETQAAIDLTLIAEYGTPLPQTAERVRAAVFSAVHHMIGLEVIEVNVEINDVHVPGLNDGKTVEKARSAVSGPPDHES